MRGRPSQLKVEMDDTTRGVLEGWRRRQKIPAGLALRARAMLLLAQGKPYTHTAAQVGLAERHVRTWAKRFVAQGVDGLRDRPRPGRQPVPPRRWPCMWSRPRVSVPMTATARSASGTAWNWRGTSWRRGWWTASPARRCAAS